VNKTSDQTIMADIAIIGGGSGGLSVAAVAAQLGAKVVLVEQGKMGGDCLNTGCVPSKALIAAAKAAEVVRTAGKFGVTGHEPAVDFTQVNAHVRDVIAGIAPHDSVERFEGLGVQVIQAAANFVSPTEIQAGDHRIKARRFVVATGSSPALPPIPGLAPGLAPGSAPGSAPGLAPGLAEVPYLTNETVFDLVEPPDHLIVIGGGPIGVELAQAHRRLGPRVTLIEAFTLMSKDDPEAVDVVRRRLIAEGIDLREGIQIANVERQANGVAVTLEGNDGATFPILGSHLLVAAGRRANVDGLGLEAAGIRYSAKGIEVDARLRSSNKRVFAIGDVVGAHQFTHMAAYHAGIVIRNALFRLPAKVSNHAVPWVTYSDPELAHVGLNEVEARARHGEVRVLSWSFADNDRARAERDTEGLVKVVVRRNGRILGATIVGRHAGELILPWVLAIDRSLKIGAMANLIAPYPTLGEVSKRVAASYYTDTLFGSRTRSLVRALRWLG